MRFTDTQIKGFRPKPQRYEMFEDSGLGVRVGIKGKVSWICFYRLKDGRQRRLTLGSYPGMGLSAARTAFANAREAAEKGRDPAAEKIAARKSEREAETVADLIHDYVERYAKPNKRSAGEDERILDRNVAPAWGRRKVASIRRRDVVKLLDEIKDRGAPVAANRTLALLSRMFRYAIERDIVEASPIVGIRRPHKEIARDRNLSDDEVRRLWHGLADADMAPLSRVAIKLLLTTAQRRQEVVGARMSEFDREGKTWTIPAERSKNGLAHIVPLSDLAIELLAEVDAAAEAFEAGKRKDRRRDASKREWLFPSPLDNRGSMTPDAVTHALRINLKTLKLEDVTIHDLRRTAATNMGALGIDRFIVDRVLNHVDRSVGGIYDRFGYFDRKRAALDTWASKLKSVIDGKQAANIVPIRAAG